jgi:ABC-type transporter Mla maintaining outer membrane lipid asymmetry ATPase subunit MlaF
LSCPRSGLGAVTLKMIKRVGMKFQSLTNFEDLIVCEFVSFGFSHRLDLPGI